METEKDIKMIKVDKLDYSNSDSDDETSSTISSVSISSNKSDSDDEPSSTISSKSTDQVEKVKPSSIEVESVTEDGSSDSDVESEDCSTTELLAADPLYFVLSRFFMTEDGKSIVTVLNQINETLGKIAKNMKKS